MSSYLPSPHSQTEHFHLHIVEIETYDDFIIIILFLINKSDSFNLLSIISYTHDTICLSLFIRNCMKQADHSNWGCHW